MDSGSVETYSLEGQISLRYLAVWAWWMPGESYLPEYILATVKCELWNGAVFQGSGPLLAVKGNVNATAYVSILAL